MIYSSIFRKVNLILPVLVCWCMLASAQPLQVSVTVTPPYSVHLSDYMYSGDNVLIMVTNTARETYKYKLIPDIQGDNGVSVTFKDSYQPAQPITIGELETQFFHINPIEDLQ